MESKNVFAAILASGTGSRMGNFTKPKQFLEICNKPILIHTISKFISTNAFDLILVVVSKDWLKYATSLLSQYEIDSSKVVVIEGGSTRNDSLNNAIKFITTNYTINDTSIVVTHDSVRPFVTKQIINANIDACKNYDCCDTVVPATDTIIESLDGKIIQAIPARNTMYQSQTPQSFKINEYNNIYPSLTNDEKKILTDVCKIFTMKGRKVHMVFGSPTNFKITYSHDVKIAEVLLQEKKL
ncbi:MAG: 2-C-methyl-D-erythritol 4-phosphate cytidylyltransferase [Treponema sp. CETP13]|nr:MAG: 2-C-methyl-D-erythritol 4-phosphate cytidylyltransferase [Treponema sp. CETP13]